MVDKNNDKIALVTSASYGVGKAIALAVSGIGYEVILTARREQKLREVKNEVIKRGKKATVISTDL